MTDPTKILLQRCEATIDRAIERGAIPVRAAAAWREGAQKGADVQRALEMVPDNASIATDNARAAAADPAMQAVMASFSLPSKATLPPAAPQASAPAVPAQRPAPAASTADEEAIAAELARGLCFARGTSLPDSGPILGIGSELAGIEAGS